MKHIIVQNLANETQTDWVFVGIPKEDKPKNANGWLSDGVHKYPYVAEEGGIRVLVTLPPTQRKKLELLDEERKAEPFAWSPYITSDLSRVVPTLVLGSDVGVVGLPVLVSQSDACQIWRLSYRWEQQNVNAVLWATCLSGLSHITFTVQAVYGSTQNNGQPQSVIMPELRMVSGVRIYSDFAIRNGQQQASWDTETSAWSLPLVPVNRRWHRASRFETRGALLCSPSSERASGLPIQGVYAGWDGKWMALGPVPALTPDVSRVRARQLAEYMNPTWGSYTQTRPRTQPHESGTTGEQPDFGCSSDLAVTALEPWEIHDALWQCQSYVQRPTGNREPDGSKMDAAKHPAAETMGQRPDLSLGLGDRIGWPGANQIGWIPSPATCAWTPSDDQHRADNFLHATYALTRDPALKELIEDHIELDKTDIYVKNLMLASPRSVGRLALTRANQVWLGFASAESSLLTGIFSAIKNSPLTTLPPDRKVRTIGGYEQAKYGWTYADGRPIIGWQPWQESIAAIGFLAAARVLRNGTLQDIAIAMAKTINENAWRIENGKLLHAYAIRWNEGNKFQESDWPTTSWTSDSKNDNIYVTGACNYWTLAMAYMLKDYDQRAKEIVSLFGSLTSLAQARWTAL
jgi:hypothetical protein